MQQTSLPTRNSGLRVFSAYLLSALLIMMPFVQLAAAEKRSEVRGQRSERVGSPTVGEDTAQSSAAAENVYLNAPIPKPAPEPLAPMIVATKDDGLPAATTVAPGGTITYNVNIQNNGTTSPTDDALNLMFSDTIDAHTTLVANSRVAAVSDKYNAIGNTTMSIPDGTTDLLGNDFDPDNMPSSNVGMAVTGYGATTGIEQTVMGTPTATAQGGSVTVSGNGSFTYNPPLGFEGADTFKYRAADSGGFTAITTVTITIAGMIWYIKNSGAAGGACSSSCDGRLSNPFQTLAAFQAVNNGAGNNPAAGDNIFLFESTTDYVGPVTLLNNQKFIGQDATASLASITGLMAPSGTDPFPAMNTGAPATTITSAANAINLGMGNTLRGFTVGATTGTKISGTSFGTLIVGNSASPDVTLNGAGQALNLSTGTLSVMGGFVSVATTSSTGQGINLAGIADSDGVGGSSFSFGSTTVSGSTTQGILIGTTTADLSFGNTSVTGGTDGISFQNNSAGTRTIGTLNVTGGSGNALLHGAGGGNVTVTGAATLSSAGSAVSVSAPGATNVINFQAATSATSTGAGNTAVNWAGVAGASITFNSLSIQRNNGTALNATGGGTVNVTNATGSINNTTDGGSAIVANSVALNTNFLAINSSGGTNAVSLTSVSGTSNWAGGLLTGTALGATFSVSGGTASVTYSGAITQNNNAAMVFIGGGHTTGTITFQTGTLMATMGTGLQFDNADSTTSYNFNGTTTLNGGDAGIDIFNTSSGTFSFSSNTSINNPTGIAYREDTSTANVTYNGTITKNNNANHAVDINAKTGGTTAFNRPTGGQITASTTTANAIDLTSNGGGTITFTGGLSLTTTTGVGFNATGGGTVNATQNNTTIVNTSTSTTGTALNVANTTIGASGLTFRSIASNGATSGIVLNTTGAGALTITGNGGSCNSIATCTGGAIQSSTGPGMNLTSTGAISLTNVSVENGGDDGIRGMTVNGFTMATSRVVNNGNVVLERGLEFTNLTGTASITGSTISGNAEDNLYVKNGTGTLNLTTTTTTYANNSATVGNDGIHFLAGDVSGSNNANMSISVTNCTFTNNRGDHFQATTDAVSSATQNITFQNNDLNNTVGTNLGAGLTLNPGGTATVNFNISNNGTVGDPFTGAFSSAITINSSNNSTMSGTINNNVIGNPATTDSGSFSGDGITVFANGTSRITIAITNNTIREYSNLAGINIHVRDNFGNPSTGFIHATVTGNTISDPGTFASHGVFAQAGSVAGDNHFLCADIGGAGALANSIAGSGANGGADFRVRQRILTTVRLPGYAGANNDDAAVVAFIQGRNNGVETGSATNNVAGGGGGFVGGAACNQPVAMFRLDENQREYFARVSDPEQPAANFGFAVASLLTGRRVVEADSDAATNSSMLPVVQSDTDKVRPVKTRSEIRDQKSEARNAGVGSRESGVRAHHARNSKLGTTAEVRGQRSEVRDQRSEVRRNHVTSARTLAAPVSGEMVTASIGTLPAGSSVTITFQVTVDNPPNLTLLSPPRVSNQGSVTGTNFGAVSTDDPTVGGTTDPTVTLIDLYGTTTTVMTSGSPSNQNDPVTFTATVAPNNSPFAPPMGTNPTGTVQFLDGVTPLTCSEGGVNGIRPVSGGTAACTTNALTPAGSPHTINANYSGDGNFDPSSGSVMQTVVACATNPVVTTNADSGAGSLRQAILDACNGTTIDFAIDPGAGPHTITLTTGELALTKDLTIQNTSGESITVSGNNASRVFNVNAGKTVTIRDLTVTGGNSGAAGGGGIFNDHGTLTLINMTVSGNTGDFGGGIYVDGATSGSASLTVSNSTISGNSSNTTGGGIYVIGAGGAATLTMSNSTVSGNNANTNAGGLFVSNATVTLTNVTVTNNRADNDNNGSGSAGGLATVSGMVTLHNTIVAGNFNEDGASDAVDDASGTVEAASSNNLIGDGTNLAGISNGVNGNQVGTSMSPIDPMLGALMNNGGPTFTHALSPTSPAVETGSNTAAMNAGLTTDQRGMGFPRIADSADVNTTQTVDIGAFELHPSIEDIGNQMTNEDTPKMVMFNLGDDTGSLISTVTAMSSNTTLVPNAMANLSFTGSGGSRTLTITPAANQSGMTTITVTVTATNGRTAVDTFDLTVNAVPDAPVANDIMPPAFDEDTQSIITLSYTDAEGDLATACSVSAPTNVTVTQACACDGGGVCTVGVTGTLNYNGPASFMYTVNAGGQDSNSATASLTINAVNDPPENTVPGPQSTNQNTALVFSSGNGNQISVADVDAGTADIRVTLTATNGTITLATTAGLNFGCGGCVGDGTADATMTFEGTLTEVNTAMNGMMFDPTPAFSGMASVQIVSNDLGNTGSGGAMMDTDTVNIQVSTNVSVNDASVAEPSAGTVNMLFTVTLNAPAPAGASVQYATANGGATPATGGAACGGAVDYINTNGTLNFAVGQMVRTIAVPVCADANAGEPNETFLLDLSNATNLTIVDGQAVGTILATDQPGTLLISELRTSGPAGAGDDFVEIYNNSDAPHTVSATDASAGYGVFKMGAGCLDTPVLVGTIPNGTVIPARGHYLLVGSAYSLSNYGGTGAAAGNLTLSADIENDRNVGLFSTSDVLKLASANRFDAVGFGANVDGVGTGGVCDLLREGTTLPAVSGSTTQHSYFRKMCDWQPGVGCTVSGTPKDSNDNNADFFLADTAATDFDPGPGTLQRLGAPGPENLASPIRRDPLLSVVLLDHSKPGTAVPNRFRDGTAMTPGIADFGTLSIRRRVINNTGGNVTRLRFRIVDITTVAVPPGSADLRGMTSSSVVVSGVNDPATCGANPTPCSVTVRGTTLEAPPAQASGGGFNSTLADGMVSTGTPIPPGQSVNVQFLLGVQQTGTFRFFIIVEALP